MAMKLESESYYYIYRYCHNNEIIYIGITNDLNRRNREHKKKDKWYDEKLKYEFIELDNTFIAQLYEVYLINRDNPKGNKASKYNYDVSDIQFNIEEVWRPVILEVNGDKENIEKRNEKNAKKFHKALIIENEIEEINSTFIELLNKYKNEIIKIYYDEYEFLRLIFKCTEFEEVLNSKYMPSCIIGITFNKNSNIVVIKFNKYENLNDKYKDKYNQICELLDINKLNLNKNYGEKLFISEMNKLEKKYMYLISSKHNVTIVRIKDNFHISVPVHAFVGALGGLQCVYRLPFALGLKYRGNNNIFLVHYEPIKDYEILNDELKENFKYQFYFENNNDMDLFEYVLYQKQIPNRLLSGCKEYDEELGFFYQSREAVLKVDIDECIIRNELFRDEKE